MKNQPERGFCGTRRAAFFIFHSCFSAPHRFPIPHLHPRTPLLHSLRPPSICGALPMGALLRHSFPETRTFQVWCNHTRCLSCCLTPITCSMLERFTSQSYGIGKIGFSSLLPLGVTTGCLVKPLQQREKNNLDTVFHSIGSIFLKHCILKSNQKPKKNTIWLSSGSAHISSHSLVWHTCATETSLRRNVGLIKSDLLNLNISDTSHVRVRDYMLRIRSFS